MTADEALVRAWDLFIEDRTDAVYRELETLIPVLFAAGFAEGDEEAWGFTPKGIERIKALGVSVD